MDPDPALKNPGIGFGLHNALDPDPNTLDPDTVLSYALDPNLGDILP